MWMRVGARLSLDSLATATSPKFSQFSSLSLSSFQFQPSFIRGTGKLFSFFFQKYIYFFVIRWLLL